MKTSESIGKLVDALAKAQGEFTNPERNRTVKVTTKAKEGRPAGSYSFDYATFDAILASTRPILAKYGLAVMQGVSTQENTVKVTTRVAHSSGEWVEDEISGRAEGGDLQSIGSASTYLKRYSYTAMLNIAAEEDDDGVAGAGHEAEKSDKKPLPLCPKCKTNKSVIIGKPEFGGGYVCFKKKDGCGHTWQDDPPPELTEDEAKWVREAQMEIVQAPSEEALKALGEIIKTKSTAVKNALRKLYESRLEVLKAGQDQQAA